jgi:NADH-quinone oxidoreductase subunit N
MNITERDILAILPQLVVMAIGMVVLVLGAAAPRVSQRALANLSLLGLIGAAVVVVVQWPERTGRMALAGMVIDDRYGAFFNLIFLTGTALSLLLSVDYLERDRLAAGEYYALLLFTTVGMMIMGSSDNLIAIFLGLEILSISLYVLAGFHRERLGSQEAALKYFLLGAFSSAFFLYGIALIYGATQSLNLQQIYQALTLLGETQRNYLVLGGVSLMLVGFAFKVAVVPFHVWTPDVYEGAPTVVTAFMSVGAKAAGFAAFGRVLGQAFSLPVLGMQISAVIASVAALTMVVGNVVAVVQNNVKRMLAYSSIAHAGYILVGLVAALREPSGAGMAAVLYYTLVYTFGNLGAFGVILALRQRGQELLNFDDYQGLGYRYPLLGVLMSLFMLSLAGLPPTAGFFGKLYLFEALLQVAPTVGMPWLVVVAVLTSVVSFYYYLRLVTNMYMRPAGPIESQTQYVGRAHLGLGLLLCALGTLLLGILPSYALTLAKRAGEVLQVLGGT